jgi:hypothetical protein
MGLVAEVCFEVVVRHVNPSHIVSVFLRRESLGLSDRFYILKSDLAQFFPDLLFYNILDLLAFFECILSDDFKVFLTMYLWSYRLFRPL